MKSVLVGGPLLGNRHHVPDDTKNIPPSWLSFEPIMTPQISLLKTNNKGRQQKQRFILLPHERFISVLAYNTGAKVATLVPFFEDEEQEEGAVQVKIESVALAQHTRGTPEATVRSILDELDDNDDMVDDEQENTHETVVLVGCSDGSLREFSLENMYSRGGVPHQSGMNAGPYEIPGLCYRPRRRIQITKNESLTHLAVPVLDGDSQENGVLIYATARARNDTKMSSSSSPSTPTTTKIAVLRVLLPLYDGISEDISLLKQGKKDLPRKWHLDSITCKEEVDRNGVIISTLPFTLKVTTRPNGVGKEKDFHVFVVLGRTTSIHIYYDNHKPDTAGVRMPVVLPVPTRNPLTTISLARSGYDITCGYSEGNIVTMHDILKNVEKEVVSARQSPSAIDASTSEGPVESLRLSGSAIMTHVHWHAHPVSSLFYDANSSSSNPTLYSGGKESVLVTWQVGQGRDRPSDILPRVALGGIVHVSCATELDKDPSNGILVYCEDNSLQLFQSHNKGRLWKVQGLACRKDKPLTDVLIESDPRVKHENKLAALVISRLTGAPGYVHWYNPGKQRLNEALEVVPYNRISRMNKKAKKMPAPTVVHHAFSSDGGAFVSLDETATENSFVGATDSKMKVGVVSTIRFWTKQTTGAANGSTKQGPYRLEAAMTYPHGPSNRVHSLALSKDGAVACTVSADEKALRIWFKVCSDSEEENGSLPSWTCRYKLTIPAGFSNFVTPKRGTAFSDDGSVLGVTFGQFVTLWDVEEATYLTCLQHVADQQEAVTCINFVSSEKMNDKLLISSPSVVSLRSPFASSASLPGWSKRIKHDKTQSQIGCASVIESHGCVAIAAYDVETDKTNLVFVNATTGKSMIATNETGDDQIAEATVEGRVISLCSANRRKKEICKWSGAEHTPVSLKCYCLTSHGEILLVTTDHGSIEDTREKGRAFRDRTLPKLETVYQHGRKRTRTGGINPLPKKAKASAMAIYNLATHCVTHDVAPLTKELPTLGKNFVRAFIGRGT